MTTVVRNGAQLVAAVAKGGSIQVAGACVIPGGNLNVSKRCEIEPAASPAVRPSIVGRLVFKAGGTVVDGHDPFTGLLLDGFGGPANTASWTVDGASVQLLNAELTNRHSNIGVNTFGGAAAYLGVDGCRIHGIGKMPPANHDHGVYLTDARGTVSNTEIWDCADRAIQFRGSQLGVAHDVFVHDCGEGVIFGDLNAALNGLTQSVLLDNRVHGRYLIEAYQAGKGNVVNDVYAWNADGRPVVQPGMQGVTVTNLHHVDPMYDRKTGKLKKGSPATGYGPAWIQP